MSVYLHDIPLPQAKEAFETALKEANLWRILGSDLMPLDETIIGQVVAEPIWARLSSPHYHASAMDGFAVRAFETDGATMTAPNRLLVGEQTIYLDTGDPLPDWANAVIPIEETEPLTVEGAPSAEIRDPHAIHIRAAVPPWKHVRPMGEDIVATQLVLPAGHTLRPVDLGAIAGSGHSQVHLVRRPRVAVIPTGTELKPVGEPVQAGDIIEYNSLVLAAQINEWGGQATRFPITPDNFEQIQAVVKQAAADHDLILLNAGSSAGAEDFSASVITSLGSVLVHGIAVRPGHPVILGMITIDDARQVPILGVPGYPVSAALTGEIFVEPLLARWLGRQPKQPLTIKAQLTRKHVSPLGDDEYARVAVGKVGDRLLAAPLTRGAGVITSLVRADGIAIFPAGSQGQPMGSTVNVNLYRTPAELEQTILAIGSHDMTLDLLAQFLALRGRRLASANVGSLAGLVALRREEAHLAGSHLLDPETGRYNHAYIDRYLPEVEVEVITLVGREQGLMVPHGNPKQIHTITDLARDDIFFVNRQRGAGTRVLLDYHLQKASISPETIQGYQQEEFTHLSVAAAVASGRADCTLGIAAAARALDLTFIPLFSERYDLVVPAEHAQSDLLRPLLNLLHDTEFQTAVAQLPGYDISSMGQRQHP